MYKTGFGSHDSVLKLGDISFCQITCKISLLKQKKSSKPMAIILSMVQHDATAYYLHTSLRDKSLFRKATRC